MLQMYLISSVETFNLNGNDDYPIYVDQDVMKHGSVSIRHIPRHRHGRLKQVQVNCFCFAESMFELTCLILKNASSLKSHARMCIGEEGSDTIRCSASKSGKYKPKSKCMSPLYGLS